MAKRAVRQRTQLPACYYEGYLEKRSFKDKTSRKLWASLCGNTLFFFNEKRDTDYIEKLDLGGFISVTDDGSQDWNLEAARFNLQMKDGNVKFTASNAEARELWKGFIHSVAELSVPSSLNLLPGQIHMLKETVEREKERIINLPSSAATQCSPYVSLQADMPACYHSVSRLEAELLLERESKRGNLLLRPGSDGNSFAVTTRQDYDGSLFRHYRVTRKHVGGFIIDVDNPVPCATLHDVITYLVDKTDGVLIPLIIEDPYEKNISFIRSDNENGERSLLQAPPTLVPPNVPPKPVVPKMTEPPEPEPASIEEEPLYLNNTSEEKQADSSAILLPEPEEKPTKKAILPPTPAPRKFTFPNTSQASSTNTEPRMRTNSDAQKQMPLAAISELKLKLEKKMKCQE